MRQAPEFSPCETSVLTRKRNGQGEVQQICGESKLAYAFAGDEVEIATETVACCALATGEGLE